MDAYNKDLIPQYGHFYVGFHLFYIFFMIFFKFYNLVVQYIAQREIRIVLKKRTR